MTRTIRIVSALALVLALGAGCKKDDKAAGGAAAGGAPAAAAADPSKMSVDQMCDKAIGMMTEMGGIVEKNKGNCDGMGTGLQKWADDNKAFMEFAKAQDKDEAKKKEFDDKCKPKMEPMMEKIGPMMMGAMECKDNEKVKKAMESMGG